MGKQFSSEGPGGQFKLKTQMDVSHYLNQEHPMNQSRNKILTVGLLGLAAVSSEAFGRQLQSNIDPNCHLWDYQNDVCAQCSFHYYYDAPTELCTAVDDQCKDWSAISGDCTACYQGYTLKDGQCILPPTPKSAAKPTPKNGMIDKNCNVWDYKLNVCTECVSGYTFTGGYCQQDKTSGPTDPYCNEWDYTLNKCKKCSFRYFFNESGKCEQVSDFCKEWDNSNGDCTACYDGFTLKDGACNQ